MPVAWAEPGSPGCTPASCYGPWLVVGAFREGCRAWHACQPVGPATRAGGMTEKSSREEKRPKRVE